MDKVFMLIGMVAFGWWFFGILLIAFKAKVHVATGAPLGAKLAVLFTGGFVLPFMLLQYGQVPAMILAPDEMDEEQQKALDEFRQSQCGCPRCKARRGE